MISARHAHPDQEPFRVLAVCTANACRSPMAEHMLRRACSAIGLDWDIGSAGVYAQPGRPMHPWVVELLAERSISADGWCSRRLDRAMIAQAEVVLTATAEHRSAVVALDPGAAERTFTLLQFARLVSVAAPISGDDADEVGTDMLAGVARARASMQPVEQGRDDLPDPIGRPRRVFAACAAQIQTAIDQVSGAVRLS